MIVRTPFQWNKANFAWETNPFPNQSRNPFTWDDCALLLEIAAAAQGGHLHQVWKDKKKKKRFVELLCIVEGKEYKETKSIEEVEILIKDVELVLKEAMGIDLKVKI